jgi:hypothetical protein
MNQLLRKTSFASGLILLFAPIVFSSALKLISSLKGFLYTFNPEQILLYAIFLIVTVLEVVFFIKLFRAYRLHEPHAYYLVYFLGMLTTLGMLGASFSGTYQHLQIIKIIFFFVLLFSLFSFRYQKENFVIDTSLNARNNILIFLILAAVFSIASYYISVYFISERFIFPYFLPALISLVLIPWWRKRVTRGTLRSFLFLPGFYIVVAHLVLQLFVFYAFFQVIQLGGRSW